MKIIFHLGVVAAVTAALPVSAAQFKIGAHQFTLPEGFTIELVAGTNLTPRPIEADFDELGRLYVTDSSGSNDKPEKQLAEKPHRVLRLEDTDGDGRFDKSVVFADRMMFPEGAMWRDGSLYVAAPPSIWKLTDTNNDGVADVRMEWMKAQTLTGCANDLHGPYAGPDGWIYWCKGAFAKQTNTLANGREFISRASHIFRARPDGTGLEPVMTGGMDNPVGLTFTPEGERILSGTFFQNPEGGKRDGLIHALYGGVYGKPNDALDGHPRTGDLMPIMTHLGPAAPAGLMRYESDVFGPAYQNNLFVACFNLHKIVRCILKPEGSTYQTHDEDFLVSDNSDFHPTDVFEDADGSLLVIDTGGWYKLCCPTSQLPKPDVLGGIYRIRRQGAPRLADPRGLAIDWIKLDPMQVFARLGDARPAVRRRAIAEVAARGVHGRGTFERGLKIPSVEVRRNLVWALTRIDSSEARHLVREALTNREESVRRVALESVSAWRDGLAARAVQKLLRSDSAPEQALAAEVLGRLDYAGAIPDLLSAAGRASDRMLAHALTYALIEIADPTATAAGLSSNHALTHRAALIALDQMPGGHLQPEQVMPLLASADPVLKQTAAWIVAQHRDWGSALRSYFTQRLREPLNSAEQAELVRQIAPLAHEPGIQEMIVASLQPGNVPPDSQLVALRAMAQANLKQTPESWSRELARLLGTSQGELLRQTVATARTCPAPKSGAEAFTAALLLVGKNSREDAGVRLNALAAVPRGLPPVDGPTFDFLRGQLAPTQSVTTRSAAAGVLAKAQLSGEQLHALTEAVRSAGPLELPKLLGAFSQATNENLGMELISALQVSKSLASLRTETVMPSLTNFPGTVQRRADELLASLHADTAQQKAQVDALLASAQGGDIRRGQGLFNSPKVACSSCHAIGYLGGNVGPDLTRIGQIRNERDLLEALLFPSASFVRSYEPMIIATKSGEEYSGVLRKDAADEVVLATGPGTEQRIARSDISDMRPGAVSVMPSGLVEQLTKTEIADLLAFLKATRW